MEDFKSNLVHNSCDFLSRLLDNPSIVDATFSNSDAASVEGLFQSLSKLSNKCVSVVPEKLFLILNYIKVKKRGRSDEISWHYCDLCYEDTTMPALWAKHLKSDSHLANSRKSKVSEFLCTKCGLFLVASESKLTNYLNSVSHRELDSYFSGSLPGGIQEEPQQVAPCDLIFEKICSLPILVFNNNSNKIVQMPPLDPEIKGSLTPNDFLFSSAVSYFQKARNHFYCTFCETHSLFMKGDLIDHLSSELHAHKENKVPKAELCLLLCKFCGLVVFGTRSGFGQHKLAHLAERLVVEVDKNYVSNSGSELHNHVLNDLVLPSLTSEKVHGAASTSSVNRRANAVGALTKDTGAEETVPFCPSILSKLCKMFFFTYDYNEGLLKYASTDIHKKDLTKNSFDRSDFLFNFQYPHFKSCDNPLICLLCKRETRFQKEKLFHHYFTKNHIENETKYPRSKTEMAFFLCTVCQIGYLGEEKDFKEHIKNVHSEPSKSARLVENAIPQNSKNSSLSKLESVNKAVNIGSVNGSENSKLPCQSESSDSVEPKTPDSFPKLAVMKKDTGNEEIENICHANILYKLCEMFFYTYDPKEKTIRSYVSTNLHKTVVKTRNFNKTEFLFDFQHMLFKSNDNPLICLFCETETRFQKEKLFHHFRTKSHLRNESIFCHDLSKMAFFLCGPCQVGYIGIEEDFKDHVAKFHSASDEGTKPAAIPAPGDVIECSAEPSNGQIEVNDSSIKNVVEDILFSSQSTENPFKPRVPEMPTKEEIIEITKDTGEEETEDLCPANILYKLFKMFFFTYSDEVKVIRSYASTNHHKREYDVDGDFNKTEFLFDFQFSHFKSYDNPLICLFCKTETRFQKEKLYHHYRTKRHIENESKFCTGKAKMAFFLCSACQIGYIGLEKDFRDHVAKLHPRPDDLTKPASDSVLKNEAQSDPGAKEELPPCSVPVVSKSSQSSSGSVLKNETKKGPEEKAKLPPLSVPPVRELNQSSSDASDDNIVDVHITVLLHKLFETFMYKYDGELFVRYGSTNLHRKDYYRKGDFNKTDFFFRFHRFKKFDPPLHCYICNRDTVFAKQQLLHHLQTKRHIRKERGITGEITFFFCNLCENSFYGVTSQFYDHIEEVHNDTRQRSPVRKKDDNDIINDVCKVDRELKNIDNQVSATSETLDKLTLNDDRSDSKMDSSKTQQDYSDDLSKTRKVFNSFKNDVKEGTVEKRSVSNHNNESFKTNCEVFFKIAEPFSLVLICEGYSGRDHGPSKLKNVFGPIENGFTNYGHFFLSEIKPYVNNYHCGPCKMEFDREENFVDHFLKSCNSLEDFRSSGKKYCFVVCIDCCSLKVDLTSRINEENHLTHKVSKENASTSKRTSRRTKADSHTEDGENSASSDEELEQMSDEGEEKVEDMEVSTEENLKLVFEYIQSRYLNEPFCEDCPTMYYCDFCPYSTSLFNLWDLHLKKKNHRVNVTNAGDSCKTFHCDCCGVLVIYSDEKADLITSDVHTTTDVLIKQFKFLNPKKDDDFYSNCKDQILSLEEKNVKFTSKLLHVTCKEGCSFLRRGRAKWLNIENPLVLINESVPTMRAKLTKYIKKNDDIVNEKDVKYFCLDCFSTKEPKKNWTSSLSEIDDHLYNEKHTNELFTGSFNRIMFLCNVCSTMFIASSECNLLSAAVHKSVHSDCDHEKLLVIIVQRVAHSQFIKETWYLFDALEKYLMNSYLKCFLFKGRILYSCGMCRKKLKNLKLSKTHLLGGDHPSKNLGMIILLCYVCGRVVFYNSMQKCGPLCCHLSKAIRCYTNYSVDQEKGFVRRGGQQLKLLSPVKVEDDDELAVAGRKGCECPILTSDFELFNLMFSYPDFLANIYQRYNTPVYPNITSLSDLQNKLGISEEKMKKIKFHCEMCNEEMTESTLFLSHLFSSSHKYNTYSCTHDYNPAPLTMLCKTCDTCLLSGDAKKLENHFKLKGHLGARQITASPNNDNEMWANTILSAQCKEVFSCKDSLTDMLQASMQEMDVSYKHYSRLKDKIRNDIQMSLSDVYPQAVVYFFGSRETGLAKKHSDIDVFVDIGYCYNTSCDNPDDTIGDISRLLRRNRRNFEVREVIVGIRVPLVKLWHRQFNFFFDINCLDASGVENSKLLRVYLSFDERVWWLVTAVKEWASMNCIRGSRAINSYSFVWLVLFFLMQPHVAVIPPVNFLKQRHTGDKMIINDWDYSFSTDLKKLRKKFQKKADSDKLSFFQLMAMFFEFYSNLETDDVVLCPLTGRTVDRSLLAEPPYPSEYSNVNGVPAVKLNLRLTTPVILLDPLLLDYNVLRNVHVNLYEHFKVLCAKTLFYCGWLKKL